ncbi:hypothetical protein IP78_14860 [Brevundimonas sp. AAP58]|uniref:DUF6152 family protein n=1 Tax=Brevundimonas sp. AAP58 TaxID=1523422 RepID=UPI0006B9BA33|nr:DUF6152 family protein [Brevundimonas sp. AAP58]KPF73349.1 hypothetical protein IP78_14860 [Brevundimonas sp. AAP58]
MTLRFGPAAFAFGAVAVVATAAAAHHGWSSYDAERTMRPTAQVIESSWGSPHGAIVIAIDGQRWDVVLAPVTRMQTRGLAQADIAVGRTVTVEGYPRRDGTREIRAERIIAGDKTVELR